MEKHPLPIRLKKQYLTCDYRTISTGNFGLDREVDRRRKGGRGHDSIDILRGCALMDEEALFGGKYEAERGPPA